jgi:hypothetical protein
MNFPVIPTSQLFVDLQALLDASYPATVTEAKIHLFKNNVNPDVNFTVASFEEADYEDYTALEIVMGVPSMNDQGLVVAKSSLVNFSTGASEVRCA